MVLRGVHVSIFIDQLVGIYSPSYSQTLNDEISERQAIFDNLHTSRGRHLFGEEDSVEQLQETFSRVEQGWTSLTEEVRALPEAMAPWKDLTDRFDDLSDWFDRLERKVERDFTAIEQQEVAGGDLSDFIVAMKVSHGSREYHPRLLWAFSLCFWSRRAWYI